MDQGRGEFAVEITSLAESCAVENFKHRSITLLEHHLAFDSAQWVTRARIQGEANRNYVAAAYLHHLDQSKLVTYQPYINDDPLLAKVIAQPNVAHDLVDVWPDNDYFSSRFYQEYASCYDLNRMLCILLSKPQFNFSQAMTVYRHNRAQVFAEHERVFFEWASNLMASALRHCILENVGSSVIHGVEHKPRAVLDKDGFIFEVDALLQNWLHSQILNFDGAYFPKSLLSSVNKGGIDYKHYRLEIVQQGDLYLVYFHSRLPFDSLTPKEWEVARLALENLGNKAIAKSMGNVQTTVQKHLQNIYVKLDIAELNDNHEKRRILTMLLSDYLRHQESLNVN